MFAHVQIHAHVFSNAVAQSDELSHHNCVVQRESSKDTATDSILLWYEMCTYCRLLIHANVDTLLRHTGRGSYGLTCS